MIASHCSPEDFCGDKLCADGAHPLWVVDYALIDRMKERRKTDSNLDFQDYRRQWKYGQITPCGSAIGGDKSAGLSGVAQVATEQLGAVLARRGGVGRKHHNGAGTAQPK